MIISVGFTPAQVSWPPLFSQKLREALEKNVPEAQDTRVTLRLFHPSLASHPHASPNVGRDGVYTLNPDGTKEFRDGQGRIRLPGLHEQILNQIVQCLSSVPPPQPPVIGVSIVVEYRPCPGQEVTMYVYLHTTQPPIITHIALEWKTPEEVVTRCQAL